MGQRSQIYVRYYYNGKYYLTARYYQWNYGERMISRCRHTLEWIQRNIKYNWLFSGRRELIHIMDTNFDMKDCVLSSDIVQEWKDWAIDFPECSLNDYVFKDVHNNDGKLFIDIKDEKIKYVFLDDDCNIDKIMSADKYMDWNDKDWRKSEYITQDQKKACEDNIKKIKMLAKLMTQEEIEDFINYIYDIEIN